MLHISKQVFWEDCISSLPKQFFSNLDRTPSWSTCLCFLNISTSTTQSALQGNTKTTNIIWRPSRDHLASSSANNGTTDYEVISWIITYQVTLWFHLHPLLNWYTAIQIHWWRKLTVRLLHFSHLLVKQYSDFQLTHCHLLIQVLELLVHLQGPPSKLKYINWHFWQPLHINVLPYYHFISSPYWKKWLFSASVAYKLTGIVFSSVYFKCQGQIPKKTSENQEWWQWQESTHPAGVCQHFSNSIDAVYWCSIDAV